MEDLNDAIFNSVKTSLEKGDDMLVKICMGTATEEEKKKWQDEKGLSDEVVNQLKEYCDIGYNTACKLDNQVEQQRKLEVQGNKDYVSLLEKVESLTLEVSRLTERLNHLENDRLSKISDRENARILQIYNNNL